MRANKVTLIQGKMVSMPNLLFTSMKANLKQSPELALNKCVGTSPKVITRHVRKPVNPYTSILWMGQAHICGPVLLVV